MNYPRDNHPEHRQAQARSLFSHRELVNVQKNFDPTVLFPCAESKGEMWKDKKGGRVGGTTTASSVSSGNAV